VVNDSRASVCIATVTPKALAISLRAAASAASRLPPVPRPVRYAAAGYALSGDATHAGAGGAEVQPARKSAVTEDRNTVAVHTVLRDTAIPSVEDLDVHVV